MFHTQQKQKINFKTFDNKFLIARFQVKSETHK